jgi:hypothetical protein
MFFRLLWLVRNLIGLDALVFKGKKRVFEGIWGKFSLALSFGEGGYLIT